MSSTDLDQDADDRDRDVPTYVHKTSLIGAPLVLRLKTEGLAYDGGRVSGVVPYERIKKVRLSFRPVTMQTQRYLTEVWADGSPKLRIASTTWRSLMELARQDAPYNAFVIELHRRLAAAGSRAEFITGMPRLRFALGAVVFIASVVAFGAMVVHALSQGDTSGAALVGGFFLLFIWQVGTYLLRNRPGAYRPDAVPPGALPPG